MVWLLGPVVSRLSRTAAWDHRHWHHLELSPEDGASAPSFAPLDLGPVKMAWPSERPWGFGGRPEPQWPSASWDDPQFGRHRGEPGLVLTSPDQPQPLALRENASPQEPAQANNGPNIRADELEALVAELGLAGTVEHVMAAKGIGFKQAARLISSIRARG